MIQEEKGYKESNKSETEGARIATVVSDLRPDSEVPSNHPRRHYTDKYKKEVVIKVAELRQTGTGQIGSYLRSEGIYYSMVMKWENKFKHDSGRSHHDKSSREALEEKLKTLEKELQSVRKKLAKTELIVEIQKKISQMLQLEEQ